MRSPNGVLCHIWASLGKTSASPYTSPRVPTHEKRLATHWFWHEQTYQNIKNEFCLVLHGKAASHCSRLLTLSSIKYYSRSAATDAQALVTCSPALQTKNPPPPRIEANQSHTASLFNHDQPNHQKPCSIEWQPHVGHLPTPRHAMKAAFKTWPIFTLDHPDHLAGLLWKQMMKT